MTKSYLIKLIQQLLNILLGKTLKVDGIVGDNTNNAIDEALGNQVIITPITEPVVDAREPKTAHFSLDEYYSNAYVNGRKQIKVVKPPKELWGNIQKSMDKLEILREQLGNKPISILSGYRSPEYNAELYRISHSTGGGGVAKNSPHMRGTATDIKVRGLSPQDVYKKADALYTKGGVGSYKTFVHVDLDTENRRPARW